MTADDRELLIRIDTKLTVVCGENGDGGVLASHDKRIRVIEDAQNAQRGFLAAMHLAWTGIIALVTVVGEWLYHRH